MDGISFFVVIKEYHESIQKGYSFIENFLLSRYEHMKSNFNFEGIDGVRLGDPIHIHSYNFKENKNKLSLSLHTRISTDSAGIAKSLGLNAESKVELQDLISILEPKLIEANRLRMGIPS